MANFTSVKAGLAPSAVSVALSLSMAWPTLAQGDSICGQLVGVLAEDTIVSSADNIPADHNLPSHCKVRGVIEPRVGQGGKQFGTGFELRLPHDWIGKFLFQGGGGFDGTVNPAIGYDPANPKTPALSRGFAVAATDAGHYGSSARDSWFGVDKKAQHDNGYNSVRLVTERSRMLMERYYGYLPEYSYFMGCSNGGRQGMVAATRYPEYFEGVLAAAPAFDITGSIMAWNWNTQVLHALAEAEQGGNIADTFSDSELHLISHAAINACDEIDGMRDGLVMAPMQCQFDPATLLCDSTHSNDHSNTRCLSEPQVEALKKIQMGPVASDGRSLYAGWTLAGMHGKTGFRLWEIGATPGPTSSAAGAIFQDGFFKNMVHTPPNPNYDSLTFELSQRDMLIATSEIWDATSTDYDAFISKGGKLLIWHGTADGAFSTPHLVAWFERLTAAYDDAGSAADFTRLYLAPGVHHCAGGEGLGSFDALTPLIEWVERDKAPGSIAATGIPPGALAPVTRPLCPHPSVTTPSGDGDFSCKTLKH